MCNVYLLIEVRRKRNTSPVCLRLRELAAEGKGLVPEAAAAYRFSAGPLLTEQGDQMLGVITSSMHRTFLERGILALGRL